MPRCVRFTRRQNNIVGAFVALLIRSSCVRTLAFASACYADALRLGTAAETVSRLYDGKPVRFSALMYELGLPSLTLQSRLHRARREGLVRFSGHARWGGWVPLSENGNGTHKKPKATN